MRWRSLISGRRVCNTFMFDDTSAVGFPFFTNRPVKATAQKYRVEMIPWLVWDVARSQESYVYSLKGAFSKGASRWCTQVFDVVRALKTSGTPAAEARTAIFIGDNCSENKNVINLAFCSDLVKFGWYDSVLLMLSFSSSLFVYVVMIVVWFTF